MMNDKQIASYKEGVNKMIEALRAEWDIASQKGRGQYASNLNGRIKGLEFSLSAFKDVLDNED